MVSSVDAWEDAAAFGRGKIKRYQKLQDNKRIPAFLQAQWHEEVPPEAEDEIKVLEACFRTWQDIVSALEALERGSPGEDICTIHPARRLASAGGNPSNLAEVHVGPRAIWAMLRPRGFAGLQEHRVRISRRHRGVRDRVIVNSVGQIGKTSATVLLGEFLSTLHDNFLDSQPVKTLVMRQSSLTGGRFEIVGLPYMYVTPAEDACYGRFRDLCVTWDLEPVLDAVDVLRARTRKRHFDAVRSTRYKPMDTNNPSLRRGRMLHQ